MSDASIAPISSAFTGYLAYFSIEYKLGFYLLLPSFTGISRSPLR